MNFDQYDLTPGLPKFDSQQYGSQDQPLYNTTPLGNQPTIDTENDQRTSYDYKSDYQQALRDTADPDDNEGYFISSNGNKYENVDNTRKGQLRDGIVSYLATFFATGGDNQKAFVSSYNAIDNLEAKTKRFAKINELESKGYNSTDIQNFVNNGDPKSLIASKGKWKIENGYMVNDLTGEVKDIGMTPEQQAKNQIEQDKLDFEKSKFDTTSTETQRHNMTQEELNQQKIDAKDNGGNGDMYLDDNKRYLIVKNGSGGPITSQRSGEVFVKDTQTGKTGFMMGTTQASDAAAQSAQSFVDMTDASNKQSVLSNIDFSLFGGDNITAAKRTAEGLYSPVVSNNQNHIDTLNGAIKGMVEDKLTVENRGQRPSVQQIKAAIDKIGKLTMDADAATNKATIERARQFASSTMSTADANRRKEEESTERHAIHNQARYEGSSSTKPEGSTATTGGLTYKVINGVWRLQQ